MRKTIAVLAVIAGLTASPAMAEESAANSAVIDQVISTSASFANPVNWLTGVTLPEPAKLNLSTPKGYRVFLDPETYVHFMNPEFYTQFVGADFYTPFFKGENLAQWVKPVAYLDYVNPLSYVDLINPLSYVQYLNPAVYTRSANPLAYVDFIRGETYQGWLDLVRG